MSLPTFDRNYQFFDFEVVKEEWNEYSLNDGARIKIKFAVTRIIRRNTTPPNTYEITGNAQLVVITDPNHRGEPALLTPEEQREFATGGPANKIPVNVLTHSEVWNQYHLIRTDEVLRVKLILVDVYRLPDKYDDIGEPMYYITTGNVVAPLPLRGGRITP